MTGEYRVPFFNQVTRRVMRPIFRGMFHVLGRVELLGFENIPQSGPYVVAINHISLFEVPFMAAFWPTTMEIIGAADVWRRPGQSLIARLWHGIQVKRNEVDRSVFRQALSALEAGRPLMIAPEGGRTHTPGLVRGKPGVAYIVDKAGVPVIPVGVVGTTEDYLINALKLRRPTLEMRVGEPVRLPPIAGRGKNRRDMRQRNVDIVMAHIAKVLPENYRGKYKNFREFLDAGAREANGQGG